MFASTGYVRVLKQVASMRNGKLSLLVDEILVGLRDTKVLV